MIVLNAPSADQESIADMDANTFGKCVLALLFSNKVGPCTKTEARIVCSWVGNICSGQQFLDMTEQQLAMALFQHCHHDILDCDMQACEKAAQAMRAAVAVWQQDGDADDGFVDA